MHGQKLEVLNHFTHVGMKPDGTEEFNNNTKHEREYIRKKRWYVRWDGSMWWKYGG